MLKMELDALTTEIFLYIILHFVLTMSVHSHYVFEIFFSYTLLAISKAEQK